MAKRYWLMKSEPSVFSIDDLRRAGVECWDGVRNYQARNLLRDEVKKGDGVLFYHSNAKPAGIAGLGQVVREAYADPTALDPDSEYFDPKSSEDNVRFYAVDVKFMSAFAEVVSLAQLKETPGLEEMMVTKRGMRLSVQPVTREEWKIAVALGRSLGPEIKA